MLLGRCVLDQPLTPVDVHEIPSIKEEDRSNETIRPYVIFLFGSKFRSISNYYFSLFL